MLRALLRVGILALAASVALVGLTAGLHAHADQHDGTCLDTPSGEHSRAHVHGTCVTCLASRHVVTLVDAPPPPKAAVPAPQARVAFSPIPVESTSGRTFESRAPPSL
jgi:hypothetical protein